MHIERTLSKGTCVLDTDCTTGKCQEFRKANGLARECVGLAAAGSPCQENENCESLWCDNDNTCRDCSAVAPRVGGVGLLASAPTSRDWVVMRFD